MSFISAETGGGWRFAGGGDFHDQAVEDETVVGPVVTGLIGLEEPSR
jgi:hypothetical protein